MILPTTLSAAAMNLLSTNHSKHVLDLNSTLSSFVPMGNAEVEAMMVGVAGEHELRHDGSDTVAASNPSLAAFISGGWKLLW